MLLENTRAYLYRWTHIPTGKWYVGSRTSIGAHPEDGYYCSSKEVKPLILANPQDWQRKVLAIGNPVDMLQLEAKYLTKLDAKNDVNSFNRHNGDGKFTTTGSKWTDERRVRTVANMTGKKKPEGFGDIVRKVHTGKTVSDKTKKLIGAASTGRIQDANARKKNSISNGGANNPSFQGYYTAPDGTVFDSSFKAGAKYSVTRQTIVSWAKKNKHGWSFTPKKDAE
jgi:hypothetical protein